MRISLIAGFFLVSIAAAADVAAQVTAPLAAPVSLRSIELELKAEQARRSGLQDRILTALGGAALGAGVGFFASQVVIGDWDEEAGKRTIDRPVWAAVGGSVGFALGFSFPYSGGKASGPAVRPEPRLGQIDAAEIQRTGASNAYEAVKALRPQWLIERGTHIIGETSAQKIRVYLDGNELGRCDSSATSLCGVAALRTISVTTIASIEFVDAAAASLRWGAGHSHGAILVIGN